MRGSVIGALDLIQTYMHPQLYITCDGDGEEDFFTKAVRHTASVFAKPHIELPPDAAQRLLWMARLDTGGLAGILHAAPLVREAATDR
jgi:hypothetical protein